MQTAIITLKSGQKYEISFNDWDGPNSVKGKTEDILTLKGVTFCQAINGTFNNATISYNGFPVKTKSLTITVRQNSVELVYLKA